MTLHVLSAIGVMLPLSSQVTKLTPDGGRPVSRAVARK